MPVPIFVHPKIVNLDFSLVDFYDLTTFLFENYGQSIFEPLKGTIKPEHYIEFVRYFPDAQELVNVMNYEACAYIRLKVLHYNGFTTKNGYSYSKKNIVNVYKCWI